MASDELCWLSATDLAALIRRRKVSPVEVVDAVLDRIGRLNPQINAYVTVTADEARRTARAAERDARPPPGRRSGRSTGCRSRSRISSSPRASGRRSAPGSSPTTCRPRTPRWSRGCRRPAPSWSARPTRRRSAGWERPTTCSSGPTRNPWRLDRTPGGSSGGASAAVAAGLAPIAVGTDGGGSIRIPASFAGIFGHKPSYGRIPTYPASAAWSLSHIGPMTRTVADAALAMQICAGPDERDPYSLPAGRGELRQGDPRRRQGAPGRLRRGPGQRDGARSRGAPGRGPGRSRVPRAGLPGGDGGPALAVARGLLVRDLLRGARHAAPPVPGPPRRHRAGPPGDRRGGRREPADPVRAGLVRPAGVVAAPARLLRALRPPADADGRLPAVPGRPGLSARRRGQGGRAVRMAPVHVSRST